MKIKFVLFLSFIFFTRFLSADTNDSLVHVYNNGKHDTLKIKAALELASKFKREAPEKTLQYANYE